jgi:hypothetical protein
VVVVGIKTKAALFPQAVLVAAVRVLHLRLMRLLVLQILVAAVAAVMGQMALALVAARAL